MGLAPGSKLGPYEIVALLGAGGMGEVYKARDPRLNRFVALKVLPADKVSDTERTQRFTQEARAASALNHPNIVTIYEIGEGDAGHFIAMEFVPGKTLSEQIPKKGLPLKDALNYAIQIADACAAAHAAGIVHRDLKPGNVMVTENGTVKVLDFGLAKLVESAPLGESDDTETDQPRTQDGMILGTASYMSPEQAKGKKLDARSDIFSFGSLLYEMLTGRRAFEGDSKITTLAAILDKEPDPIDAETRDVPREVIKIVQRCLQKQLDRRAHSMVDVKLALEEAKEESDSGTLASAPPPKPSLRSAIWIVGALLLLGLAGAALWFSRGVRTPEAAALQAVPFTTYPGGERDPKFSPDGNQVAFSWNGEQQDNWDIYVKLLGPDRPLRLTAHPGVDRTPVWSPDGRSIAFLRDDQSESHILIVPALGGPERQVMISAARASALSDWTPDGRWLVLNETGGAAAARRGIYLVSVATGELRQLTSRAADSPQGDALASISPDGRSIAFARRTASTGAGELHVLPLTAEFGAKGEPRRLTSDNRPISGIDWSADGREIVFSSQRGGSFALWRVDASGSGEPRRLPVGENARGLSLSRRGNRLVYSQFIADDNIWRLDLTNRQKPPLMLISSTREDRGPDYSPDGRRIAFVSGRSGSRELWLCDADGANASQLTSAGRVGIPHWSPDGQRIVFPAEIGDWTQIFTIGSHGGAPQRMTQSSTNDIRPNWSHDGKWIYFGSNRSGSRQIWKIPASGGEAVQVSTRGGSNPYESVDGKTIFYFADTGSNNEQVWSMRLDGGGEPEKLGPVGARSIAVTRDGIYSMTDRELRYFAFTKGTSELLLKLDKRASNGLSVSPDGRWLLYSQTDQFGSDLMLVENFR